MRTKSRMLLSAIFCLSLTAIYSAYADIGETAEQITRRYGKVLERKDSKNFETFLFRSSGLKIEVSLDRSNSRSCMERYEKIEGPLTDEEVARILSRNSGGAEWTRTGEIKDSFRNEKGCLVNKEYAFSERGLTAAHFGCENRSGLWIATETYGDLENDEWLPD